MLRARWFLVLAAVCLFVFPAQAGQVRVDLNSTTFTPTNISLNVGDHVVWVWNTSMHNVISGTSTPSGRFNSGAAVTTFTTGGGTAWTWKSSGATGNQSYFCQQHLVNGMTAVLNIQASGVAVSDFRITEIQYGAAGTGDRIEISNLGDAAGNLGRYRIAVGNAQSILPVTVPVAAGGRITIMTNQSGTNTATTLFQGPPAGGLAGGSGTIGDLGVQGSVALYAPFRQSSTVAGPLDVNTIIDFVQWGLDGQPNADIAESAALWPNGDVVSGESNPAYSISFCGNKTQHGALHWNVTLANFGTAGLCSTPTLNTSWGRIKTIYR